jgi:hypothetical protein
VEAGTKQSSIGMQKYRREPQHDIDISDVVSLRLWLGCCLNCVFPCFRDPRQAQKPALAVTVSEKVYCMDVRRHVLAVATAERGISVFDLRKPTEPYKTGPSPLKFQARSLALFTTLDGYALSSVEGRVAIQYLNPPAGADPNQPDARNFSFRCHRVKNEQGAEEIFPVNGMAFHPVHGTFATVGGDGIYTFWDHRKEQQFY